MNFLLIAVVLLFAFFALRFSSKLGVPSLIAFIFLGFFVRYFGYEFGDFHRVLDIAIFALIIIIFYEGFVLNLDSVKSSYRESILLGTLGVIITGLIIGLFVNFAFGFPFVEGLLLGSILSSTDAVGIFSMLRGKEYYLKGDTASLLSFETGVNDTFSKSLTFAFIATIGRDINQYPIELLKLIIIGLGVGLLISIIATELLKIVKTSHDLLNIIFLFSMVFLTYYISSTLEGNGFLSVYILGLYMGNRSPAASRESFLFVEGSAEIMEIIYFFILGLFIHPQAFVRSLPYAGAIVILDNLIARPLAVVPILKAFNRPNNQALFVSSAGFRGATAIILALESHHLDLGFDLLQIVFGVVILSFISESIIVKITARKFDMIDYNKRINRTFNDYIYETDLGFLFSNIGENSSWKGKSIDQLDLDNHLLISKVQRNNQSIIPKGDTRLQKGDKIVLAGQAYKDQESLLNEVNLYPGHIWVNESLEDLDKELHGLVIAIIREGEIIVPKGSTRFKENDRVIFMEDEI